MLLFSCANKSVLFLHLSNDCQIVRPALVSGPPNRKKPYNNYEPRFFPSIYGPRLGHKSMEKNEVRNLQYGPKTRLIRSIYFFPTEI